MSIWIWSSIEISVFELENINSTHLQAGQGFRFGG